MRAEDFVLRLERVRRMGPGRWVARCPAHADGSPSFTMRELEDGRILVHCFAGCSVDAIVAALGISLSDLFPEKLIDYAKPVRRPFPAEDVLACIELEMGVVAIVAGDIAAGKEISEVDRNRLRLAQTRITEAMSISRGER